MLKVILLVSFNSTGGCNSSSSGEKLYVDFLEFRSFCSFYAFIGGTTSILYLFSFAFFLGIFVIALRVLYEMCVIRFVSFPLLYIYISYKSVKIRCQAHVYDHDEACVSF